MAATRDSERWTAHPQSRDPQQDGFVAWHRGGRDHTLRCACGWQRSAALHTHADPDPALCVRVQIASFLGVNEAVLYSYGACTVSSVIPSMMKAGDVVLVDEAVSHGVLSGLRLSKATVVWYKHCDEHSLAAQVPRPSPQPALCFFSPSLAGLTLSVAPAHTVGGAGGGGRGHVVEAVAGWEEQQAPPLHRVRGRVRLHRYVDSNAAVAFAWLRPSQPPHWKANPWPSPPHTHTQAASRRCPRW